MNNQTVIRISPSSEAGQRRDTAQRCLYCGGDELALLYETVRDRLRYVRGNWTFRRCQKCGSAVLSPLPTAAEVADFYPPVYSFAPGDVDGNGWRRAWARVEYQLVYRTMYDGDARRILRHTLGRDASGKSLLDVGCGRGHRLVAFQRRGCQVTGSDFQPGVVEYVRKELGIAAHCCGIGDLEKRFAPETFDLVTAFCVLEHVRNVQQMLESCYLLLKPGGWFAAAVPLIDSLQASAFGARWSQVTEAPRHISLPSRRGLRTALQQAGFTQIKLVADSAATCASSIALSLVPNATFCASYGQRRPAGFLRRLLAIGTALVSVPWCAFENGIARRPGIGIFLGKRLASAGETG